MGISANYLALYLAIKKNLSVDKALHKLDIPKYTKHEIKMIIKKSSLKRKNKGYGGLKNNG